VSRHGVAASRLSTTGYGEGRPVESNETPAGRARNRRVELVRPCAGK
jgi:chemotaxis protein MotB